LPAAAAAAAVAGCYWQRQRDGCGMNIGVVLPTTCGTCKLRTTASVSLSVCSVVTLGDDHRDRQRDRDASAQISCHSAAAAAAADNHGDDGDDDDAVRCSFSR